MVSLDNGTFTGLTEDTLKHATGLQLKGPVDTTCTQCTFSGLLCGVKREDGATSDQATWTFDANATDVCQ